MALLTFRLLGPAVIERNGTPVDLKRAKACALITYLACNPQRHSRNHLASLLWPEVDEAHGLASLRNGLWELQRLLGTGWLETARSGVQFLPGAEVWVDAQHFRQLLKEAGVPQREPTEEQLLALSQAVALYRGRLVEGLDIPGCPGFDEWSSLATEQFHLQATQALERLSSTLLARGRLEEALPHTQRLVALEPTNEEAHRRLMRLYGWQGRWTDALRQHRHCAEALRGELGALPQQETNQLLEALKARSLPPPPSVEVRARPVPREEEPAPPALTLPAPSTPLYGRDTELRLILQRLEDPACRLLTLTGPGGIGKTTLALEAARRYAATHPHEVGFVPLASVDGPERVPGALLEALELPASHAPPEVRLREHLRSRELLLVLDNLEHLLPATRLLGELLAHAPALKLLVTSRERLNLRGEWLLPVEGLPYPQGPSGEGPREALELFALLAARADASFHLGPDNEAAVARICQLVHGTPLGLELAAAWVPFFPPGELARRLEEDLGFLAAPRDVPERHQSLRATFLHSWRLLSAEEQDVLRRLSVFRSGATREAAAAVAGATLPLLTSLGHKSLLRRLSSARVELHGLLHQYAEEELRAQPEAHQRTHQRHAEYFLQLLARLQPHLQDEARQAQALSTLDAEQEELRAALRQACQDGQWALLEASLEAYGLAQELRGRFHEASAVLAEAVAALRPVVKAHPSSPHRLLLGRLLTWQARFALGGATRSPSAALALVEEGLLLLGEQGARAELTAALLTAGRLALRQGNVPGARWNFLGCLSLARASGQRAATAQALYELAEVATHRGRPEQARRLLARGLATFRLLGEERHVAACLGRLASLLLTRGELEKAASSLHQGLALLTSAGLPLQAAPLRAQLAEVLLLQGVPEEARRLLTECLRLGRAAGHPETVAQALHGLGLVAVQQGAPAQARPLLEEALTLRQQLGARRAIAESLEALGRLALSEGDVPRARGCLQAALRSATEVGAPSLLLDVLLSLTQLPSPSGDSARLQRATLALLSHPLTPHPSRQRAATRLTPQELPPPCSASACPLPQLVADVLGAVGMA